MSGESHKSFLTEAKNSCASHMQLTMTRFIISCIMQFLENLLDNMGLNTWCETRTKLAISPFDWLCHYILCDAVLARYHVKMLEQNVVNSTFSTHISIVSKQ